MKTGGTNLLLLTISAFWSSSRWMSSRRHRSIPLGGRYRHVSLYHFCMEETWEHVPVHWRQGKYRLWVNCLVCWMPASNACPRVSDNSAIHTTEIDYISTHTQIYIYIIYIYISLFSLMLTLEWTRRQWMKSPWFKHKNIAIPNSWYLLWPCWSNRDFGFYQV